MQSPESFGLYSSDTTANDLRILVWHTMLISLGDTTGMSAQWIEGALNWIHGFVLSVIWTSPIMIANLEKSTVDGKIFSRNISKG